MAAVVKLVWLDQVGVAQAVRQEDSLLVVPIAMIPAPAIFTIPRLVAVPAYKRQPTTTVRPPVRRTTTATFGGGRTARRTIRRTGVYVATLPRGCIRTTMHGYSVWRCGGVYYQPHGGRYVVVRFLNSVFG